MYLSVHDHRSPPLFWPNEALQKLAVTGSQIPMTLVPGPWPYKSNMMREPGKHYDGRVEERQDHQVCL
jgi:hypothetical protein